MTRSANSLHDRADELMKFDVIGHVDSSLPPGSVTFTSSTLLDRDDRNLVGTITEEGQSKHNLCRNENNYNPLTFVGAHRKFCRGGQNFSSCCHSQRRKFLVKSSMHLLFMRALYGWF